MPERHTAENLSNVLQATVESWGIADKVDVCAHDNTTNIVLPHTHYLEWQARRCFAGNEYRLYLSVSIRLL